MAKKKKAEEKAEKKPVWPLALTGQMSKMLLDFPPDPTVKLRWKSKLALIGQQSWEGLSQLCVVPSSARRAIESTTIADGKVILSAVEQKFNITYTDQAGTSKTVEGVQMKRVTVDALPPKEERLVHLEYEEPASKELLDWFYKQRGCPVSLSIDPLQPDLDFDQAQPDGEADKAGEDDGQQ